MIVHKSIYEDEGWINVDKELPVPGLWVECIGVNILDWNLEVIEFRCKGRITGKNGIWARRGKDDGTIRLGQKVTHWRFIDGDVT